MTEFKKIVCEQVSAFVRKNIKYLLREPTFYGFESKEEMIKSIKEDFQIACWALTELLYWKSYWKSDSILAQEPFVAEKLPEDTIYNIENYYFTIDLDTENNTFKYQLKKKVEKTIIVWEDAE